MEETNKILKKPLPENPKQTDAIWPLRRKQNRKVITRWLTFFEESPRQKRSTLLITFMP